MKDIMVISIYDGGYGFSIMIDNKIIKRKEWSFEKDTLADEISKQYHIQKENFVNWVKEKYKNKTIIICDSGDIEIYKNKRE